MGDFYGVEVAERIKTSWIDKTATATRAQVGGNKSLKTPSCMWDSCEEPWKVESFNTMHQNRKKTEDNVLK